LARENKDMKRAVNYLKKEINRLNREEGDKAEE